MLVFDENENIIMKGTRENKSGMWQIPLPITKPKIEKTIPMANGIIKRDTAIEDLCNFLHGACFSPSKSTFIKAIKAGFLSSWPGLTAKAIQKYLIEPEATIKGHLD
jgi:hypothetical protein